MMLYYKGFSRIKTKRVVFEDILSVKDSASLEQLKELSAWRRLIEESINDTSRMTEATAREMAGGLTSRCQQDLQKLEQYLPLLKNLIIQIDSTSAYYLSIKDLKIRWTSTLSSSCSIKLNGPKFFQIDSLKYELGMILFLYGITLRERAFEVIQEDLQQCASLLKKAAGVYSYLTMEVLPLLQPMLPPEKPPEVITNTASAMSLICLSEAQVVAVQIAEKKGLSAGVLAKLHCAVTQFLDEAISLLQSRSKEISGKLLEFLNSCRTLHELRSHRHLAESYKANEQMGVAIGLLNRALKNVKTTPKEQPWRTVLKNEGDEVSEMLTKYNKENLVVWSHKVPPDFELPALEGKKMVTATPYEPPRWERQIAFKT